MIRPLTTATSRRVNPLPLKGRVMEAGVKDISKQAATVKGSSQGPGASSQEKPALS